VILFKNKKQKSQSSMNNGRFFLPSVGARFKRWERKLSKSFSQTTFF
jgi:hypothetical protein